MFIGWETLIALGIYISIELITSLITKTPLWVLKGLFDVLSSFWRETVFLQKIIKNEYFRMWDITEPKRSVNFSKFAELRLKDPNGKSTNSMDLAPQILKKNPILILGKPGAGKSTILKALYYKVCKETYKKNIIKWFLLDIVSLLLLSFLGVPYALLWITFYVIFLKLISKTALPIYVEGQSSLYISSDLREWLAIILLKKVGCQPTNWENRCILFLDGLDEMEQNQFSFFVNNWGNEINQNSGIGTICTCRIDYDPSLKLGIKYVFTVSDLETDQILSLVAIYRRIFFKADYELDNSVEDAVAEYTNKKDELVKSELAKNPYWLKLIVQYGYKTYKKSQILLDSSTTLLEREIEEKSSNRYKKINWVSVPTDIEMDALSCLANKMYVSRKYGFYEEQEWVGATIALEERLKVTPYKPLDVILEAESATLIKHSYREYLVFLHPILQDFFAAYYFQNKDFVKLFIAESKDIRRWRVLFFLAELIEIRSYSTFKNQIQKIASQIQKHKYVSFALVGIIFNSSSVPLKLKQDILDILAKHINENWNDNSIFARELLNVLEANAIVLIKELLENSDSTHQESGIKLLKLVGPENIPISISLLSHENLFKYAIEILINSKDLALEPIISLFKDVAGKEQQDDISFNKITRACRVLIGLGRLGSEKLVEYFEPYFKTDDNNILFYHPFMLQTLIDALGILKEENAVPFLKRILVERKDISTKKKVLDCLVNIGSSDAQDIIENAANNHSEIQIRDYALACWEDIVAKEIQTSVARRDLEKAQTKIKTLKLKSVIDIYGVSEKQIKQFLLAQLLSRNIVVDISIYAKSEDLFTRENAIEILGEIGKDDQFAIEVVSSALSDEDNLIKYIAIKSLGKIGDIESVKNLKPLLKSKVETSYGKIAEITKESILAIEHKNDIFVA